MFDVSRQSFSDWNGIGLVSRFVGWGNCRAILTQDPVFWGALVNTVLWTVASVTLPDLVAFGLALGLNQPVRARAPLRVAFYLPVIIASIAVATIWRWMHDPFFGLLTQWGMTGSIQDWLSDRDVALWSVFGAHLWSTVGFSVVLFLAGLQGVSQTLIEAARIDGAGRYRVFRHVTLPALGPTIAVVLVPSLINSLKAFDIVCGMIGGGPAQPTKMLAMWAYTQAMQLGSFGCGAAISVFLLGITLVIVVPYLRWTLRRVEAQARSPSPSASSARPAWTPCSWASGRP